MNYYYPAPPVGSEVTVITQHQIPVDIQCNFYKDARVLSNELWFRDGDFKISSDVPHMKFRVINTRNVIGLIVDGVVADLVSAKPVTEEVKIQGSKDNVYTVIIEHGIAVSCTCPGYNFRHSCRHLKEAVDKSTPTA